MLLGGISFVFLIYVMNYYGICKTREKKSIRIFYRITEENKKDPTIFFTIAKLKGNKRGILNLALLKADKHIGLLMIENSIVPVKGWTSLTEDEFIGYLKKGVLSESSRKELFRIFGNKYFGLTNMEREYFTKNFATPERLIAFYRVVQKEKRMYRGYKGGKVTRDFEGNSIIITSTKIRKASRELFGLELDDIMKAT